MDLDSGNFSFIDIEFCSRRGRISTSELLSEDPERYEADLPNCVPPNVM